MVGNESHKSVFTFRQALEKLKKMSNVKNLKHKTHKPFVRPTNVPFLITKKTNFEKETNWKPKLNFDKILLDTLNYWRNRLDTAKF